MALHQNVVNSLNVFENEINCLVTQEIINCSIDCETASYTALRATIYSNKESILGDIVSYWQSIVVVVILSFGIEYYVNYLVYNIWECYMCHMLDSSIQGEVLIRLFFSLILDVTHKIGFQNLSQQIKAY
uniref:Uncharacterized protein n=1 Tax=Glossina brevipalpis TaxID=37001 RepID=A0A1A9X278_9MUSC